MKLKGILLTILGLLFTAQVNAQNVQDTFMGMKLGTKLTDASISANVGTRGTYSRIDNMVTFTRMSFANTMFAGHKWDSAYFYRDKDNVFYGFEVRDFFSPTAGIEAHKEFKSWREKLSSKYVVTESNDESGENRFSFHGDNGVKILLTFEIPRFDLGSTGGYRLSIEYIDEELYNSVMEATNDEL